MEGLMSPKPFEQPFLIDEPKRFRVFDHGEWVGTYETAAEVWVLIKDWEIGRDRVYDSDRISTREDIETEASGK